MKRLSRKARKQKKQEEQCREKKLSKAGIPYSKHKKRICYHFGWSGDMALGVRIYVMTEKDNDNRYVCRGCGSACLAVIIPAVRYAYDPMIFLL